MARFKPRFGLITLMAFVTACAVACWAYLEFVHQRQFRLLLDQLGSEDTQSTDGSMTARQAFDKLLDKGRAATPALVRAALQRDPHFEELQKQPVPQGSYAFGWLSKNEDARKKSETERRADRALAALVHAWNAGWIPPTQQRQLAPYLDRWAVSLPSTTIPRDGGPMTVDLPHMLPLHKCPVDDDLWLSRRIVLLVDDKQMSEAIDFYEDGWVRYKAVEAVAGAGPRVIFGHKAETHVPTLKPERLAPGKHTLTVKVLIGPAEPPAPAKAPAKTADAPPWYTEIALEPLEFEIVHDAADTGSDEPSADAVQQCERHDETSLPDLR